MNEIKVGWYYILKNSEDINDVVQVLEVFPGQIKFKYFTGYKKCEPGYVQFETARVLSVKAFKAVYKEHVATNAIYANN